MALASTALSASATATPSATIRTTAALRASMTPSAPSSTKSPMCSAASPACRPMGRGNITRSIFSATPPPASASWLSVNPAISRSTAGRPISIRSMATRTAIRAIGPPASRAIPSAMALRAKRAWSRAPICGKWMCWATGSICPRIPRRNCLPPTTTRRRSLTLRSRIPSPISPVSSMRCRFWPHWRSARSMQRRSPIRRRASSR